MSNQHTVAIDALARDAIEPLGDVEPIDPDDGPAAVPWLQLHAPVVKEILQNIVTGAAYAEENLDIHQPRLVERDDAVAVGPPGRLVHRAQFHQRYTAASRRVNDLNREVSLGCRRASKAAKQKGNRAQAQDWRAYAA